MGRGQRAHGDGRRWGQVAAAVMGLMLVGALLGLPASAAYPGADGRIAFARGNQIFTVTAAGRGLRQLTTQDENYRPRYSPDGNRIAYIHETAAGAKSLWVMRADGTGKTRVTAVGAAASPPTWSPDGTWLIFGDPLMKQIRSTTPFGAPQVLLGYVGSDELTPLEVNGSVAASPDGRHIAYYSPTFPDSPDDYILVYDRDTRDVEEWLAIGGDCCGEGYYGDLAWGPVGGRLAFTDGYYEPSFDPDPVPPVVSVTTYPTFTFGTLSGVRGDKQPAFAPSGGRVVLTNGSSGTSKLYVVAPDGSPRRYLTDGYHPDWQPRP